MRLHLLILAICCSFTAFAQQDWQLQKNTKGIKVYYRDSKDSFIKELKMTTTVDAPLSAVYALLNDLPEYKNWIYGCSSAELLGRASTTEMRYYAVTDFPWPMSDRDYVVYSKTTQDSNGTISSISIASSDERKAPHKDMVRITNMKITWLMTPQPDGTTLLDYYLKSDPGGNIPAWAINLALDRGPMQSILGFKKLITHEKYQNAVLPDFGKG